MRALLLVGAGGFVGAILRYSTSALLERAGRGTVRGIPVGTLAVNVVGCLLLGWLLARLASAPEAESSALDPRDVHLLVGVGFLGALTTFSTFGHETLALVRAGQSGAAIANVGLQLALGLGAVWLGLRLAAAAG